MDIEKLIEQLKRNTDCWTDKVHGYADLRLDAATALSTLQAENEKLRDEVERQRRSADDRQHLYENAERAYMKVLTELEQMKREREKLERFLGELEGAVYTGQYFHLRPMIEKWRGQKED